jgi:hypothetical protein
VRTLRGASPLTGRPPERPFTGFQSSPLGSVNPVTPRRLPFVLLAVLALLTAGFAVLGVVEGPSIADLSVTNATSATYGSPLGATSFTLDVVERAPGGQVEARQMSATSAADIWRSMRSARRRSDWARLVPTRWLRSWPPMRR